MSTVIVNVGANTAALQAALTSAITQLAVFKAQAAAAAAAAGGVGGAAGGAVGQINNFNIVINNTTNVLNQFNSSASSSTSSIGAFLGGFAALGGVSKFNQLITDSRDAVIKAERAFRGLESVASNSGVKIVDAMKVVKEFTKDGLVDSASASKSLQNLLSRGYSLDESKDLLNRLKDSSAYGAQAGKTISEAVQGATEGLKNENSALVDNAGVTKNVAKMWEEFAGKKGLFTADLSDSQKRMAEYNGIMAETTAQMGNAAEYAKTLGGEISLADSKSTAMKETLGQALTPAFQAWNTAMGAAAEGVTSVVKTVQNLGAGVGWTLMKLDAFGSWFQHFDSKKLRQELDAANNAMYDFQKSQYSGSGAKFDSSGKPLGKAKTDGEDTVKEKYEKEKASYETSIALAKGERKVKEDQLALELATFKKQLNDKIISLEIYKAKAIEINGQVASSSATFFEKVGTGLESLLKIGYKPKEAELKVAITNNNTDKEQAKIKNKMDDLKTSGVKVSGGKSGASSADAIAKAEYERLKAIRDLSFEEFKTINNASISLTEYQFSRFKISAESYYSTLNKFLIDEFNQKQENIKKDIDGLKNEEKRSKNAVEKIKLDTEIKTLNSKLINNESEFKQKYDENTRSLQTYNDEIRKNKALQSIDSTRLNKDSDLSLRQVQTGINRAMGGNVDINEDKIIENAKFANTKESIAARRKYILENEKENTQELLSLDKELEDAKRQHILSIASLNAESFLKSKENYLSFMSTVQSSLAGAFVEINKHPKNFKEATLNALGSIHTKIMQMIAENWAKKLLNSDDVKNPLSSYLNMMGFGGMQKQPDLKDDSIKGASENPEVKAMATNLTSSITEKLGTVFDGVSSMFSNFFSGLGSALSSVFSSMSTSGGSGGGGGIMSFIGGLFSSTPALASGTNYVPQDNMLAFLHKGEAVVPAAFNNDKFGRQSNNAMNITNNFRTDQPQSRYSQSQQASLAVDLWNRGGYNR